MRSVVFISKTLTDEETITSKCIIESFNQNVEYTSIPNDSNLYLTIVDNTDIIPNHEYANLTLTFFCLRQMSIFGINPFEFKNQGQKGLKNIFLLNKKIFLYKVRNSKYISSLILSMGGKIAESKEQEVYFIITDSKSSTQIFNAPLINSAWIDSIFANVTSKTIGNSYECFQIPKKSKSKRLQPPIKAIKSSRNSDAAAKLREHDKTQDISTFIVSSQIRPKKNMFESNTLKTKILSKKKDSYFMSQNPNCHTIQEAFLMSPSIPKPKFVQFQDKNLTLLNEDKDSTQCFSPIQSDSDDEYDLEIGTQFNKADEKLPVFETPPIKQIPPKNITPPNCDSNCSPKLNAAFNIIMKSSSKKSKTKSKTHQEKVTVEDLNKFSQILQCDENDEDDFDVYYDGSKDLSQSQQMIYVEKDPLIELCGTSQICSQIDPEIF
ncbi:hypothetical protein TRFO_39714 [Tritrichomonas foetus]|uniref:BRCT domain-containing protein n=1 Tax=Tritrichomonas foetus TaxID=1144522 RepID=A0A1J4J3S5_9EUKA|nr:hypothetical protein TRFO_39714 [Tritrichomonas foetus]|eukprot:OHS94078.1 hypothetical protein TRFO_39714 [Tritrichomonas foetus]